MSYLQRLIDAQNSDLHTARSYIERAEEEKRELSVEERTAWDALNKQIDDRAGHIAEVQRDEQRDYEVASAAAVAPEVLAEARAIEADSDADILRKMAMGEMRSYTFERRALSTNTSTKGPEVVPQSFYDVIQENLLYVGPMMDSSLFTVLNTASGEDIKVPVENTRPVGTATAEGASFGQSDPTFSNVTLRSHKYGTLVVVSRELLEDSGIDLVGFLGRQLGVSIGTAVNNALTVGTGTLEPQGVLTASSLGITGGTAAVVGSFTADNLIDLAHSIDTAYALRPQVAWMMARATLGAVRKLKDNQGAYLYQPAESVGRVNTLLGYPVVENPYVETIGSAKKSVLFGDMSSFHVRMVGGIEVARSDEAFFTSDQVAFRARIRVDGALGQSAAVKHFVGGTA
jgi:HK97 family phage major capsid protein